MYWPVTGVSACSHSRIQTLAVGMLGVLLMSTGGYSLLLVLAGLETGIPDTHQPRCAAGQLQGQRWAAPGTLVPPRDCVW